MATPRSALAAAQVASTTVWQTDLKALFDRAKDRFPDVVWELSAEDDHVGDEVWGHKAIVYARAPPSFLSQYFDVGPNGGGARTFSCSPDMGGNVNGTQSSFSLALQEDRISPSRASRPYTPSNAPQPNPILRLTTTISPSLFSNQLEYLYTGSGIGDAFDFLFTDAYDEEKLSGDVEANRIDKLRKDLTFMWRSRLYSDVHISLTGPFSPDSDEATAVFSSHRFILASRSSYFHSRFSSSGSAPGGSFGPSNPVTITLPSPPFTPASLHFTLGHIYSGTLNFSNRTFDLTTAFQIYKCGVEICLEELRKEVEARIVEEMAHGLFHAYLTLDQYNKVTGGRWGVGGCKCKQCTRRAPRILEFATAEDVKNNILERGARRALVGLFGEGWVTPEFAALPSKAREKALKGVYARATTQNIIPLLFAADTALQRLETPGSNDQPWSDATREIITQARKKIDDVLVSQCEEVFEQEEWLSILERDGVQFNDADKVRWVMDSIRRGLNDTNAGLLYQTLVNSVLLRPAPSSAAAHASSLLSSTSAIRVQVERTRLDIIRWLRKQWPSVRLAKGFDSLEPWALKEISDELEIPVDDLVEAPPPPQNGENQRTSEHPSNTKPDTDAEVGSIHSLRASVLNRSVQRSNATMDPMTPPTASLTSSRSSVVSSVASTHTATTAHVQRNVQDDARSVASTTASLSVPRPTASRLRTEPQIRKIPKDSSPSPSGPPNGRPKSITPSAASVRSSASSFRSATTVSTTSTLRKARVPPSPKPKIISQPSPLSRPMSNRTDDSENSTEYVTAPPSRARTASTLSSVSATSARSKPLVSTGGLTVPITTRTRKTSAASVTSTASSVAGSSKSNNVIHRGPKPSPSPQFPSRPPSTTSIRSTTSTTAITRKAQISKSKAPSKTPALPSPTPPAPPKLPLTQPPRGVTPSKSVASLKEPGVPVPRPSHAQMPSESSTIKPPSVLERKRSTDTVTKSTTESSPRTSVMVTPRASIALNEQLPTPTSSVGSEPPSLPPKSPQPPRARGVTLNVGIPCMISSKRSRFKAFARYIGEVEGETGPWIGVEVPVGDSWGADKLEGRDWNDGTHGGVRYFEIGASASSSMIDENEGRASRRRRLNYLSDSSNLLSPKGSGILNQRKREGDQQLYIDRDRLKRMRSISPSVSDMSSMETRGLFIRPQQVLLVLDAQPHN